MRRPHRGNDPHQDKSRPYDHAVPPLSPRKIMAGLPSPKPASTLRKRALRRSPASAPQNSRVSSDRGIVANMEAPHPRSRRYLGPLLRPFHAASAGFSRLVGVEPVVAADEWLTPPCHRLKLLRTGGDTKGRNVRRSSSLAIPDDHRPRVVCFTAYGRYRMWFRILRASTCRASLCRSRLWEPSAFEIRA